MLFIPNKKFYLDKKTKIFFTSALFVSEASDEATKVKFCALLIAEKKPFIIFRI